MLSDHLTNQELRCKGLELLIGPLEGRGRSGPRGVRGRGPLCHHVLLPLVEPHLAEGHGAHHHVDGGGDEAVDADLLVQTVDVLRRVLTDRKSVV